MSAVCTRRFCRAVLSLSCQKRRRCRRSYGRVDAEELSNSPKVSFGGQQKPPPFIVVAITPSASVRSSVCLSASGLVCIRSCNKIARRSLWTAKRPTALNARSRADTNNPPGVALAQPPCKFLRCLTFLCFFLCMQCRVW